MRKALSFIGWAIAAHFIAIMVHGLVLLMTYDPAIPVRDPAIGPASDDAGTYWLFFAMVFGVRELLRRRRAGREAVPISG